MTKKGTILGYLAQVQRMQLEAEKVEITVTYWPSICGFRLKLDTPISKVNDFAFCTEFSVKKNQQTMEQLTHLYNQTEKC